MEEWRESRGLCNPGAEVFMDINCIVTGQDKSGKSVIVRNAPVKPLTLSLLPGYEFHRLWGSDSVPELPSDGTPPLQPLYFPAQMWFPLRVRHHPARYDDQP
jgi:hypothetical protein